MLNGTKNLIPGSFPERNTYIDETEFKDLKREIENFDSSELSLFGIFKNLFIRNIYKPDKNDFDSETVIPDNEIEIHKSTEIISIEQINHIEVAKKEEVVTESINFKPVTYKSFIRSPRKITKFSTQPQKPIPNINVRNNLPTYSDELKIFKEIEKIFDIPTNFNVDEFEGFANQKSDDYSKLTESDPWKSFYTKLDDAILDIQNSFQLGQNDKQRLKLWATAKATFSLIDNINNVLNNSENSDLKQLTLINLNRTSYLLNLICSDFDVDYNGIVERLENKIEETSKSSPVLHVYLLNHISAWIRDRSLDTNLKVSTKSRIAKFAKRFIEFDASAHIVLMSQVISYQPKLILKLPVAEKDKIDDLTQKKTATLITFFTPIVPMLFEF